MPLFSPLRTMLSDVAATGTLSDDPAGKYLVVRPFSSEASQAIASLQKINFASIKIRPIALEPVSIADMLQELTLEVDEAARLMRIAPKTLEDMCRDGRVPSTVYARHAQSGGKYHFITKKLAAFIENRYTRV